MAIVTPITIYRGEDAVINVTMTPTTDITTWGSITFTLAKSAGAGAPKLIPERACTIVNPSAGTFKIVLTAAEVEAIEPGVYFYTFWRMDNGQHRVLACGSFTVSAEARLPA